MPFLPPRNSPNLPAPNTGYSRALSNGAGWTAASVSEPPSQILEYWRVIRANIGWISFLTLTGLALGWAVALIQPAMYQTRTILDIRSLNENFLNPREGTAMGTTGMVLPESYLQTEIKILQSDSLRKRAVDRLPILKQQPGMGQDEPPSFWRSALGLLNPAALPRKVLLDDAAKRIKVRALGNTRIVEIICAARDAQLAADVCNSLSRTYIEHNLESRYQSTKETGDWLQSQLDDVRRRLTKAEGELKDAAHGATFYLESDTDTLAQEKLRQLQSELSRAEADRMSKQSAYDIASSSSLAALPLAMDSGHMGEYRARLADLNRQLAEASSTMTPQHYRVRELKTQISEIENEIVRERSNVMSRVRADFEAAKRREALIASAYAVQQTQASEHGDKAVRYTMVKHEVDTERKLYETLLQKVNEVGLATALRTSTISVVDPAVAPGAPYSPNKLLNMGLGLFLGAGLGLALSFARFRGDRTLRGPGDAPVVLQLRELGVIPSVRSSALRRLLPGIRGKKPFPELDLPAKEGSLPLGLARQTARPQANSIALASWLRNTPEITEAFSGAMNSLLFASGGGTKARVIVITSPDAGDGKTTVSANLAIALAQIGRRVVIVDGDLRKPRLHNIFGIALKEGLAKILDGTDSIADKPLSDFVLETGVKNLWAIPTAAAREGISAKLHSRRMEHC